MQLINAQTSAVVVPKLQLAATFWSRFRGLQFRRELPTEEGLLIIPARSIHTHWMRFAIDVVMIDEGGRVLEVRKNLRPWRFCNGPAGTKMVLEVPAESATLCQGDRVALRVLDEMRVPKPLRPLCENRA